MNGNCTCTEREKCLLKTHFHGETFHADEVVNQLTFIRMFITKKNRNHTWTKRKHITCYSFSFQ